MGTGSRWRAAISFAAAVLGASGVVGLAPAVPAGGQVAGSVAAGAARPAGGQVAGSVAAGAARPAGGQGPVPTVDGVRRFNVGATHSPALLRGLSGRGGTLPPSTSTPLSGVDVASFQHPNGAAINWAQVASAGYRFAFIKGTEGNYYANPYYASDLAQAKAAGLYAAGYVFAIPNVSDGISQADYAVSHDGYTADGRTLPLVLDIEYDPYTSGDHTNDCYGLSHAKMAAWVTSFAAEVQRLTQQPPIIYSTADWWNRCTGRSTAFAADPLWVAAYGVGSPPLPAGWSNWTYWQYTGDATVPGIAGPADASYFDSAMVALADPGGQASVSGASVSLQVNSLGAAAGQALSYTATGLPTGLSIGGNGLITGIVQAQPGTYPVTVTGALPSGVSQSVSFNWTVTAPQGGTATGQITGYAGMCVDDWHSGTANGTKIDMYACNGTAAQQWMLTTSGQLQVFGKCLDDTGWGGQGTGMELYTCNGGANQKWAHLANGEYVLASNGLCLNDPGYATRNGTRLIIWACVGTANERWSGPS